MVDCATITVQPREDTGSGGGTGDGGTDDGGDEFSQTDVSLRNCTVDANQVRQGDSVDVRAEVLNNNDATATAVVVWRANGVQFDSMVVDNISNERTAFGTFDPSKVNVGTGQVEITASLQNVQQQGVTGSGHKRASKWLK